MKAMRAAKAGVNNPGQPMGVFLFVGPSGVGKTELATQLSDILSAASVSSFRSTCRNSRKSTRSRSSSARACRYVGFGEGGV